VIGSPHFVLSKVGNPPSEGVDDLEEIAVRALVELRATLRSSVGVGDLEETGVRAPVELRATLVIWHHSAMLWALELWSDQVDRLPRVDGGVFCKVVELRESRSGGRLPVALDDWDTEAA